MVCAVDDDDAPASKPGDQGHLPQRPPHIERSGQDAHHQLTKSRAVTGWGQDLAAYVRAEVEVGVVHPNGMSQVERDFVDALPVAGDEVDALLDCLLDA
jgi:hypothetical protein